MEAGMSTVTDVMFALMNLITIALG